MTDKTAWTQGIKNPWQRISIMLALTVISALSSMYGIIQYQQRNDGKETLDREIARGNEAEKKLQECYMESIKNAAIVNRSKDERLSLQDSTKTILNIKQ
jgi:hypothetical protein